MPTSALDNDLVIKGAILSILDEIAIALPGEHKGILGSLPFVAEAHLSRRSLHAALARLKEKLSAFQLLEPSADEIIVAAEIEHSAQMSGEQLDGGESLLAAMSAARSFEALATGDKRAIAALEAVLRSVPWWSGRIICLEQIALAIFHGPNGARLRDLVCASPFADKALAICFSCTSGAVDDTATAAALTSYINDARRKAPTLLRSALLIP